MKKIFLLLFLSFYLVFSVSNVFAWQTYYDYRREIKINSTSPTQLNGFVIPINLTFSGLNNDCSDLLFTNSTDSQIPFELESCRSNNTLVWLNTKSLIPLANTSVYVYYHNNTPITNQTNPLETWNESYGAIYHLNGLNSDGNLPDSVMKNNATPQGTTPLSVSNCFFGDCRYFYDSGEFDIAGNSETSPVGTQANLNFTVFVWAKIITSSDNYIGAYQSGGGNVGWSFDWEPAPAYGCVLTQGVNTCDILNRDIENATWKLYIARFNSSGMYYIENNTLIASKTTFNLATQHIVAIGGIFAPAQTFNFRGWIDDVKFTKKDLSGSEISAIYDSELESLNGHKWAFIQAQETTPLLPLYLFITLISPTNTTYTTNPNLTFSLYGYYNSYDCYWNLNNYLQKISTVYVQNNSQYTDYPTGVIGGVNGTNNIQVICSNSTLTNSSTVYYTVSVGGVCLPTDYGIRLNWLKDKNNIWNIKVR
jgi:hypothetical protein